MTADASPENLRKFLESDDPAIVRMGISLAKGAGVEVSAKDLEHFLMSGDVEIIKMGFTFAEEVGVGNEAIERLCDALGEFEPFKYWEVCTRAAEALGEIGDTRAVQPLIETLEYESLGGGDFIRSQAAKALGKIGDERAVETLIKALGDGKGGNACWYAAGALGEIGDARAVEPLIKALGDENVRWAAKEALRELGREVE